MSTYNGTSDNDTYTGTSSADIINGGLGNDTLNGAGGSDTINGGAGNDAVDGGGGGDILVYKLGENTGATDVYKGGTGVDTLRMELTAAEWSNPVVQQQLALFVAHLASLPRNAAGEVPSGPGYDFTLHIGGKTLTLSAIEKLSVFVDGVVIDHAAPSFRYGDLNGNVIEDTVAGTLADTGTFDFYDLDWAQSHTLSVGSVAATLGGKLVASLVNPATGDGQGTVRWEYQIANSLTQSLGVGQTATEVFLITVKDSANKILRKEVTVVVTGTNDVPTVGSADTSGAATEDSAKPRLSDSGIIAFDDVDLSDSHTASVTPVAGNTLGGTFVAVVTDSATGVGDGTVAWTYNVLNAAVQYLALGQTAQERFTVTINDGHGGTVSRVVTVTVTGTNDGPKVSSADISGAASEDSANPTLSDSGLIAFDDVDLSDGHTASVTPVAGNTLGGSLAASVTDAATGAGGGAVQWTYNIANAAVQHLAQGQTAKEKFTVTIDDGHGGTVSRVVTITVTGTNDGLTVSSADVSGAATEDSASPKLSDSGIIAFDDVDLSDSHTASATPVAGNTLGGSLAASIADPATGAGGGTVQWTYSVANAAVQYLAQGEKAQEKFTVTVSDGHGGTVSRVVTVAVTGTNDAPVLTVAASGSLTEGTGATALSCSGALSFTDADLTDTHTIKHAYRGDAAWSGGTLLPGKLAMLTTGFSVTTSGWAYNLPNASFEFLDAGETITLSFAVTVTDNSGGANSSATRVVTLTLTGTNDAPTAQGTLIATNQDMPITGRVGATDLDHGSTLSYLLDTGPEHGSLVFHADGSYVYTPHAGYSGADSFSFVVNDGLGGTSGATQSIDVATVDSGQVTYFVAPPNDEVVSAPIVDSGRQAPEVAALTDGGHVVVWSAYAGGSNPDGSNEGVYLQRYDADGLKVGTPTLVNSTTASSQTYAGVAGLTDGKYVVTWSSDNQDGSEWGIYSRLYNANGSAATGEIRVNGATNGSQFASNVSDLAGGGYVVTWTGVNPTNATTDIYARVFGATGAALGGGFVVNTATAGTQLTDGQTTQSIVGLAGGRFAVAWTDRNGQDGADRGVYARVFEANGSAVNATDLLVNSLTLGDQHTASVAALGSGFIVTWTSAFSGYEGGIYAQRYDANGAKLGGEIAVNNRNAYGQDSGKAMELSDGGFVVIWRDSDIHGQRFDAGGTRVGDEFVVNAIGWQETYGYGFQDGPSIALREDGALVVTWADLDRGNIEQKIIGDFTADTTPFSPPSDESDEIVNSGRASPEVAALSDGGHVVAWTYSIGGGNEAVYLQRYDAAGHKLGTPEQANTTTDAGAPSVAGLDDGKYIVTWASYDPELLATYIYSRLYNANGTPATGEMQVSESSLFSLSDSKVTALPGGAYAIAWKSYDFESESVYARVFDTSGVALSSQFYVASDYHYDYDYSGSDLTPSIVGLAGGRLAAVWTEWRGLNSDVYARVFEADGSAVSEPRMLVNSYTTGPQVATSVAALGNGFIVTWTSGSTSGGIFAQRYDANGAKLGGEIAVSGWNAADRQSGQALELSDGGFVVVWQTEDEGGGTDIHGQRFDEGGARVGSEFVVNGVGPQGSFGFGSQAGPSIALREEGAMVVTWADGSGGTIEQKIVTDFAADTTPFSPPPDDDMVSAPTAHDSGVSTPKVAALSDGGHLVVWSAFAGNSDDGVYLQRYDAAGHKLGVPERVSTTTLNYGNLEHASVAALSTGKFIVTWTLTSRYWDGEYADSYIYSRLYGSDGTPVTGEMQVDISEASTLSNVTALAGGGYAITWVGNYGTQNPNISACLFDADGTALGGAFVVSEGTTGQPPTGSQSTEAAKTQSIVGLEGGRFAVVWTDDDGEDGSGSGVYARLFEADGSAVHSTDLLVNSYTQGPQGLASVAALGSGFVVTWTSDGQDGSGNGIFAQRFDANGSKLGSEIAVNSWHPDSQQSGKAMELSDGGFVVIWQSADLNGYRYDFDIHGQRFDAAGARLGGEFVVNAVGYQGTYGFGSQVGPSIALRDDGALVVTWADTRGGTIEQKIITDFGSGSSAAKDLIGGPGPDSFIGSGLADTLNGGAGSDRMDGLRGVDLLTGGSGADTFVFSTAPGPGNVDYLPDFASGVDKLELHQGAGLFSALPVGTLAVGALDIVGDATAASASTRIIYDPATGALYYDADGTGASSATPFAMLQNKPPVIVAADFWIGT